MKTEIQSRFLHYLLLVMPIVLALLVILVVYLRLNPSTGHSLRSRYENRCVWQVQYIQTGVSAMFEDAVEHLAEPVPITNIANLASILRRAEVSLYGKPLLFELDTLPLDPWGRPFEVKECNDCELYHFIVFSRGHDGVAGTEDDIYPRFTHLLSWGSGESVLRKVNKSKDGVDDKQAEEKGGSIPAPN